MTTFIHRHDLWTDKQRQAARELTASAAADVDMVRLSFVDVHGVLRGKTIAVSQLGTALDNGWAFPSSLLLKDTSHKTVFDVFGSSPDDVPDAEYLGIGDLIMVPDPTTYRVLPWVDRTGWMLCDVAHKDGRRSPLCTRTLHRTLNGRANVRGLEHILGIEIEFHIVKLDENGGPVPLNAGYQYLTEQRINDLEPILEPIRRGLLELGLPLRSMEVEFGPSQVEVTLSHTDACAAMDDMVLLRSAIKQICRGHNHHATFMCLPRIENAMASGWHLHQSLRLVGDGTNAFAASTSGELSDVGGRYLSGLLRHAAGATALSNPTVNSYRRFRPRSLAPDRVAWGTDNRGAMVRAILPSEPSMVRLENRVGDPAANPYLYGASQLVSGLAGIDSEADLPERSVAGYDTDAPPLPSSLAEAIDALSQDTCLRSGFGDDFIDYFIHIKRAELARFEAEVSEWEHREYFELF